MEAFLNKFGNSLRSFARDDEGAQVVEYALIIAVVSIALIIALAPLATTNFPAFILRVSNCLAGNCA